MKDQITTPPTLVILRVSGGLVIFPTRNNGSWENLKNNDKGSKYHSHICFQKHNLTIEWFYSCFDRIQRAQREILRIMVVISKILHRILLISPSTALKTEEKSPGLQPSAGEIPPTFSILPPQIGQGSLSMPTDTLNGIGNDAAFRFRSSCCC